MMAIPLQAVASQVVSVALAGQACRINVYQKTTGLYLDLYVNDALIIGGVICQHANKIVRDAYLGFVGDLAFFDTQAGNQPPLDPSYDGLGARFALMYLEASDLAA